MKKTNTKRALGMSLISLLACGIMFAGSTYAWFTDSVEVKGNKIETGTLKVDLEMLEDGKFVSLRDSVDPVFGGVLWEPGYTDFAVLKVENEGNLATKWNLSAVKVGSDAKGLANVIDVYVLKSDTALAAPTSIEEAGYKKIGTLADVLAKGTLLEGTFDANKTGAAKYLGIMLHMQEEAGNEYQGATDVAFDIKLNAYQLNQEVDGFGNSDYDNVWYGSVDTAWYSETASEYEITTAEEFAGFASIVNGENGLADTFAGKTVKLDANIDLNGINWTAIGCPMEDGYVGFEGTFDGQGHTISNLNIDNKANWGQGLFGYLKSKNVVIKNFTVENVSINTEDTSGAVAGYATFGSFENIHVTGDVNITGAQHMGGIVGNGYYANFSDCSVIANAGSKITATDASFVGGIVGYHGEGALKIENCDVKNLELTAKGAIGALTGISQYSNQITGCTAENIVINKSSVATNPSVGLAAGTWTNHSKTAKNAVISNNTFKNITLNGSYVPAAGATDILFGSNYSNKALSFEVTAENNVYENIVNNLKELPGTTANTSDSFVAALADESIEVIGLTDDIVLAEDLTIAEGREVTIYLNGKTLEITSDATTTSALLINKGELVIEGEGNFVYESSKPSASYGYSTSTIINSGKLTINGGNFINETIGGASYVIDNAPGAELTINGGYFYNNGITLRAYSMDGYAANNVTINGGEFVSKVSRVLQAHVISNTNNKTAPVVNITINGGTFTTKDEVYCVALYSYSYGTSMENVTFTLNGGVINGDVAFDGGSARTYPLTKYTVSSNCVVNGEVYSYGE